MAEARKQIFIWHGANELEIQEVLSSWRSAFEKKHSSFNILTLDAKGDLSRDELYRELKNGLQVDSLFGSHKLIILKNFLVKSQGKLEEVSELLLTALPTLTDNIFLMFVQGDKPDRTLKLVKFLESLVKDDRAEQREFLAPSGMQLVTWIKERARRLGGVFDPRAAQVLLSLVGTDLWQLDSEIRKLLNYKPGAMIFEADVNLLVNAKFNNDIFELMDALALKNRPKAIKLMNDQLSFGMSEMYLFTMLVRQFRLLRLVKEAVEVEGYSSKDVIARELGVHPFVVQKTLPQVKSFTSFELRKIYNQLLDMEYMMKTQSYNFEMLFDKFVAEL